MRKSGIQREKVEFSLKFLKFIENKVKIWKNIENFINFFENFPIFLLSLYEIMMNFMKITFSFTRKSGISFKKSKLYEKKWNFP